jgi:hypothetical protein
MFLIRFKKTSCFFTMDFWKVWEDLEFYFSYFVAIKRDKIKFLTKLQSDSFNLSRYNFHVLYNGQLHVILKFCLLKLFSY